MYMESLRVKTLKIVKSLGLYFSFRLFCPLRFQISPQTHQREFPGVWKILFLKTPFPGRISIPTSFASLFMFYILSYLLSKTMGCRFGCLMYSASIQKLFCGICSVLNVLSTNLWGRKWSPHPILPPPWDLPLNIFGFELTFL